jgi:hypothetical protein
MKETFIDRDFSDTSIATINTVNAILDEYRKQGFRLSLRQLYYQLVSRDYIPNSQRSYKNLGNLVSNARQAGLVDWAMIEDRNRETVVLAHWDNPGEIIKAAAEQFRIDKWKNQANHIEVMVEKDALSGVLEPVCRSLDIGITANKGYSSSSTMYEIGKRLQSKLYAEKQAIILYLGDHDPSGIDMTRDVEERLNLYADSNEIQIVRLALNWDQIQQWKPPENPAKETDSRYLSYSQQFGEFSWELDAIEPVKLAALVRDTVLLYRDEGLWSQAVQHESELREVLNDFASNYGKGISNE